MKCRYRIRSHQQHYALIFASLLLAQPANAQAEGIFGFVEDVFQFLCNRCKDIITTLDNVIENEPFKKELDNLCRTFIPEPTLQAICVNVADTILGGVYDQLKRLEPRPEICTSLRLCLECGVPQQTFNRRSRRTVVPSSIMGINGVSFVRINRSTRADDNGMIPTSAPFPAKPTLPNDLFSQFDLNKINADSSSFRHRRATEEGEKEVKEGEHGAKETEAAVQLEPREHSTAPSPNLRSKNASEPFDPVQFYGKVAELATTVARLRRMAEDQ
ncbi:spp-15 [Pristionchus pacificus]|uniref:Saposin B-type domain-containing protein n=1 Tax=Pristionchus pacificus TaxID=54126 RepID=A0A2A6CX54_PRIPA|nr:spp-15 [Pristionchus pacificus]|eukprot:PDM82739.1 hypothetical protein PRIPAC_37132 [Pristionchus pacificus]